MNENFVYLSKIETMKYLYAIICPLIMFAAGCTTTPTDTPNIKLYEQGVSEELALHRKATIDNLSYVLHFDIPQNLHEAVSGDVRICFTVERAEEIIVDFREGVDAVKQVCVNDLSVEWEYRNEHIIIPSSAIVAGDNEVYVSFTAGNQSLNRNPDYLYTLLVPDRARTLFPCFDQPDLKAEFTLSLTLPEAWCAVSNTSVAAEHCADGRRSVSFNRTEPLSTYLFSFVAGEFFYSDYDDGKHRLRAYYRETDSQRVAQLPTIFKQVAASIEWLEDYTAIDYPFAKYDFIILPGFQYGGMEHTGATLYNDTRIFLGQLPTPDEELARASLIAHETAHMWFGDYVTMAWFDDVWTKEVFANYFASLMVEPLFGDINHDLNRLKTITAAALSEDRTAGRTAIKQPLSNLADAGLIYGRTIYNKAPVVMLKLVELMGEDAFREGIREYLSTYAYGNARWEDLIAILDSRTDLDLATFSHAWVNSAGMPHITLSLEEGVLRAEQHDITNQGLLWPQRFNCLAVGDTIEQVEVDMSGRVVAVDVPDGTRYIVPNSDGRGYGHFIVDDASMQWMMSHLADIEDDVARQAALMALYENYQHCLIDDEAWLDMLLGVLPTEQNTLIRSTIVDYLRMPMLALESAEAEDVVYELSANHPSPICRLQLLRLLVDVARKNEIVEMLYERWEQWSVAQFSEFDYMRLAYRLALIYPERYDHIVEATRSRLTHADRRRQFDYIVRAVNPAIESRDALFEELLEAENRRVEPWAEAALSLLMHPLQGDATRYIRPALEELEEVQRTGDIFFPSGWASSLLGAQRSEEALAEVDMFLADNPEYKPLLKNKILQSAWLLHRANGRASSPAE